MHIMCDEDGGMEHPIEVKTFYRICHAIEIDWRSAWEGFRFIHKENGSGISIHLHEEMYGIEEPYDASGFKELKTLLETLGKD